MPPKIETLFEQYMPAGAVAYCSAEFRKTPCSIFIVQPRKRLLGTYKPKTLEITLNANLGPSRFVFTFLHELAHHRINRDFWRQGEPVASHGSEWRYYFSELLWPLTRPDFPAFSDDFKEKLYKYLPKIGATLPHNSPLYNFFLREEIELGLRKSPEIGPAEVMGLPALADVPVGGTFIFRQKNYRKVKNRRAFALCEELSTKKNYLIRLQVGVQIKEKP
ncbi:MAG: ImmA/IrrE family metallo-endopeptidase [Nitritalea sp.]